ncbi:hypothetical protein Ancab_005293, partial [Ancistrocladus abbreviatus]
VGKKQSNPKKIHSPPFHRPPTPPLLLQLCSEELNYYFNFQRGKTMAATATRIFRKGPSGKSTVSRRRNSGRPIPKRGQVKMGIVVGIAQSVASIFSRSGRGSHRASAAAER